MGLPRALPEGTELTVRGALAANWMPPDDPKARRPLLPVDASAVERENGSDPLVRGRDARAPAPRRPRPRRRGRSSCSAAAGARCPAGAGAAGGRATPAFAGYVSVDTMAVAAAPSYRAHPLLTTRGRTERQLHRLMGRHGPLADALLLGRRETLDRELSDRFARTGLVHLLAISGTHVALMGAVFLLIGRMLRLPRRRVAWLTIVLISPVPGRHRRAAVRHALGDHAGAGADRPTVLQRPSATLPIVAAAALAILAVEPMAALDIGFQLSFAGVLGIILLQRGHDAARARRVEEEPGRALAGGVHSS